MIKKIVKEVTICLYIELCLCMLLKRVKSLQCIKYGQKCGSCQILPNNQVLEKFMIKQVMICYRIIFLFLVFGLFKKCKIDNA